MLEKSKTCASILVDSIAYIVMSTLLHVTLSIFTTEDGKTGLHPVASSHQDAIGTSLFQIKKTLQKKQ